ncbi:hypothetical protein LTR95_000206 [Oleoguttula sp. CCFEE 5521]
MGNGVSFPLPSRINIRAIRTPHARLTVMHASDMLGTIRRVAEAFTANVAEELLDWCAVAGGAQVRFQEIAVGEGLVAGWVRAGVGSLAGVAFEVDVQLLAGHKSCTTAWDVAGVRFELGVGV